jgi:hypothetical protein
VRERARQRGVGGEAFALASDERERLVGAPPLGLDGGEDAPALSLVLDQLDGPLLPSFGRAAGREPMFSSVIESSTPRRA